MVERKDADTPIDASAVEVIYGHSACTGEPLGEDLMACYPRGMSLEWPRDKKELLSRMRDPNVQPTMQERALFANLAEGKVKSPPKVESIESQRRKMKMTDAVAYILARDGRGHYETAKRTVAADFGVSPDTVHAAVGAEYKRRGAAFWKARQQWWRDLMAEPDGGDLDDLELEDEGDGDL